MTRLPELRDALYEAAKRAEPARRRWRLPLFALAAALFATGAAVAAVRLLPVGEPVPTSPHPERAGVLAPAPSPFELTRVRAADPDGGLPWGLATSRRGDLVCAHVGRVQDEQLGVIGRDGAFGDDGRFHPLSSAADQSGGCGGVMPNGDFLLGGDGPPVPASGFSGSYDSPVGGCRERVDPATMSPQVRERLRDVPVCAAGSLRIVKYGFAGRDAVSVAYGGRRIDVDADEHGAYLFVLRPEAARGKRLTLTITYRDGTSCSPQQPRVRGVGKRRRIEGGTVCPPRTG